MPDAAADAAADAAQAPPNREPSPGAEPRASALLENAWLVAREARLAANRAALAQLESAARALAAPPSPSPSPAAPPASSHGSSPPPPRSPPPPQPEAKRARTRAGARAPESAEPPRRSSRLSGAAPEPGLGDHHRDADAAGAAPAHRVLSLDGEEAGVDGGGGGGAEEDEAMARKIARLKELHESQGEAYFRKNKTATYEHTWMRVRTMDDKALRRRVAVIESAVGEHCIVKMRMFSEILALAHKDELARLAQEALDRLLALVGKRR